jgi:hypothetical protein
MAGKKAWGHRRKQSQRARRIIQNSASCVSAFESLEQRRLLASITVVVTDPRFAPPGGSRAIVNDGQDDAPAIQRAIDYVPQAGNVLLQPNGSNYTVQAGDTVGTVYFPAGVYDFVTPAAGGPQLPNVRLKPGISAANVRTYTGAPGAILRRPNGAGTFLNHNAPILQATGTDARNIVIKGLTFEGAGIKLEESLGGDWSENVKITNNLFQNVNDGDGLSYMVGVSSGARNLDITNNTFYNLNSFTAIFALNIENARILNNTIDTVKLGMQVGAPSRPSAPGLEISDNRITRTIAEGVQVIPGDSAAGNSYDGIFVRRNVVSDFRVGSDGLYDGASFALEVIGNLSKNMIIENNKVFGKLTSAPPPKELYRQLPVYGIEVSGDGAIVRNNLIEGFWVPIAGNAYHNPQSEAKIFIQNNRMRGQWWSELTSGVEVRSGTFEQTGNNINRAVERAVIVGGDLIVAENSVNTTNDTINIGGTNGAVTVNVNGSAAPGSPFAPTGGIFVFGRDGDDTVTVASGLTRSTTLVGGNGNDSLTAGGGAASLFGDAGDDTLVGGAGVDSAFGSFGNDSLFGSDADLLDGGPGSNQIVRNGAPPQPPAAVDSFLSDLTPTSSANGWGNFEKDRSNGEATNGDGKVITLNGQTYTKGLGVHANSDLRYALGKNFKTFTADIGVDDEVGNNGNVTFQVFADGVKLYDSGPMTGATATIPISVDITNRNQLQLVVLTNGDASFDHADWANAKILVNAAPPPPGTTFVSDLTPTSSANGWGNFEKDRSNGEAASGDGKVLTLNGATYTKGLGVHANSNLTYNIAGKGFTTFTADIGVDDEVGTRGSVIFQVWLDGVKAYDSGVMTGTTATRSISVPVGNKNTFSLQVINANDGFDFDHGDWANAKLA